jgi:hypothetical protein
LIKFFESITEIIKRLSEVWLNIELEDLIENKDISNLEKENKPPAQKTNSALYNKVNYSVLAIILFGFIIYFFNTDLSKSKNKILDLIEVTPEPDTLSIEIHEEEHIEITDNLSKNLGSSEEISDNDDEYDQLDLQFNEEPITIADDLFASTELDSTSEIIAFNSDEDFVFKVGTTQLKSFSTQNPEKSSYYFYIISHESQKICVVDSLGALKEYDFNKGSKLSHHGSPPFKIQLNPNVSEVYFEGWKVNLQDNDYFIQLNPALTP